MTHASKMLLRVVTFLLLISPSFASCQTTGAGPAADKRPNVLFLVLDDVGFSDLGAFGSEIKTPVMDSLAKSGVKITDFHTGSTCSPSRAMLLTGTDNHVAGLGNMGELTLPEQKGKPGYEGYLNERVATVAELLRKSGYHTYMAGKWHLGKDENDPYGEGFEETFSLRQGVGGHFEVTPVSEGAPTTYTRNGQVVEMPKDFYSSVYYTEQMIKFIDSRKDDGKPFFGYLAYTAAHDPLQAPAASIAKFKGHYDAGYEKVRAKRIKRMKDMGIIPKGMAMYPRAEEVTAWDKLSPEQQAIQARKMEVYGAMIAIADEQIGRLLAHLRETGKYDNTVIFLLSDNGPNGEDIDFWGRDWIEKTYDNSLANIGNRNSFPMYEAGWAQASAGPLRLSKTFPAEGGIRTPLIISGPGVKRVGETSDAFVHITDLVPTVLEIAGVDYPKEFGGEQLSPLSGKSLAAFLAGKQGAAHSADEAIGWEVLGRAALRIGDWKMIWIEKPNGAGDCGLSPPPACITPAAGGWQLYDLSTDLAEQHDLSEKKPKTLAELQAAWDRYVKDDGLVVVYGQGAQ